MSTFAKRSAQITFNLSITTHEKFSVLVALAMLIGFGTVTTMTYASELPPSSEKDKEKKSTGPKATEEEKKDEKKDGGR